MAERPQLTWTRRTEHSIAGHPGDYRIARVFLGDIPRYELWAPGSWYAFTHHPVSSHASAQEAKAAAQAHLARPEAT